MSKSRSETWSAWALSAIVVAGTCLRLFELNASYWYDEVLTHDRASGSLWTAIQSVKYPLSNVLSHWSLMIDDSEVFLRMPNAAAGIVTIIVLYRVGRRLQGPFLGLTAALLLAVSACHIEYSQNGRYAGLIMLWVSLGLLALLKLRDRMSVSWLIAWLLISCCGLLTHPFFGLPMLALILSYWTVTLFSPAQGVVRQRLLRCMALLVISICAGIPSLALGYGDLVKGLVPDIIDEDAADADTSEPSSTPTYAFTLEQYADAFAFVTRGLLPGTIWFAICLGGVGIVWGVVRAPVFGVAALFAGLGPLALLPFEFTHHYSYSYFAFLLPIWTLATCMGVLSTAGWGGGLIARLAKRSGEDQREAGGAVQRGAVRTYRNWGHRLAALALAGVASFNAVPALAAHYAKRPSRDWRAAADYLAKNLHVGDRLFVGAGYLHTESRYRPIVLRFYLDRLLPNATAAIGERRVAASTDHEALKAFTEASEGTNVWLVLENAARRSPEFMDYVDAMYSGPLAGDNPTVHVRRQPSDNVLLWRSFEGDLAQLQVYGDVEQTPSYADHAQTALMFQTKEPGQAGFAIPPPRHSKHPRLANGATYTLSFWLRTKDIEPPPGVWSRVIRVALSGKDKEGRAFYWQIARIRGTQPWTRHAYQFVPGWDAPGDIDSYVLVIRNEGGAGTFWVDDVQLEFNYRPSPFVGLATANAPAKD